LSRTQHFERRPSAVARRPIGRKVVAVIGASAVAVALAACGGGDDSSSSASSLDFTGMSQDQLYKAAKDAGEDKITLYTVLSKDDLDVIAKPFEAKYPGIKVEGVESQGEDSAAKMMEEANAGVHSVDILDTEQNTIYAISQQGLLAKYDPPAAKDFDSQYKHPTFTGFRIQIKPMAYNTKLIKGDDVPKTYDDLLDPKYKGKIVKSHPGYSGNVMTATYAMSKLLGWDYFQKLGQQGIMQVQSSTEPPKILSQGERAIQADGNEYNVFILQEKGVPITAVYPAEGTSIAFGNAAILAHAPHPAAAKLFYDFMFTKEAQQLNSDFGGLRSVRPDVVEKSSRTPLSKIKVIESDPAEVRDAVETIKQKYEEYFGT
jgi:iron(III) transport system substrate-binding protein